MLRLLAILIQVPLRIFGLSFLLEFLRQTFKIPGSLLLILVNLIPIYGVFYLNWNIAEIILLYWGENVIIGFFTFFKILQAQGTAGKDFPMRINGRSIQSVDNSGLAGFFAMHYGIFTFVHGIFVFIFVFSDFVLPSVGNIFALIVSFIALCLSHGISYYFNFIRGKEYLVNSPQFYFASPYARIIVTHITITAGGAIASAYDGKGILALFIGAKIIFDLIFHIQSHKYKDQ